MTARQLHLRWWKGPDLPEPHHRHKAVPTTLSYLAQKRLISPHDFWEGIEHVFDVDYRVKKP